MITDAALNVQQLIPHLIDATRAVDVADRFRVMRFAHASSKELRGLLNTFVLNRFWPDFADSWNKLPRDAFMADEGRYRRRRFGVFTCDGAGSFLQLAHQPHYQSKHFNVLNGGVERWFAPLLTPVANSPILRELFQLGGKVFCGSMRANQNWRIEVHQMRINADNDRPGKPTPEGLHRDGVDHVLIMLIGRQNVAGGATKVTDSRGRLLATYLLEDPLEALFLDDLAVRHGVSPIWPISSEPRPAYRDALIVTWKRLPVLDARVTQ